MYQTHILGILSKPKITQNIEDVFFGQKSPDEIAFRTFIGLEYRTGLPISFAFTSCVDVNTASKRLIHRMYNTPENKPTGIVRNKNYNALMMQPVTCGQVISALGYEDARLSPVEGFRETLNKIALLNMDLFAQVPNPAALIVF